MVVWGHLLVGTAENIYDGDPVYVALIQRPWHFGTFGVELFFVISGFVILPSVLRYGPREFALRRILRIYPLFFVFTLLFALLNAATNLYPHLNTPKAVAAGFLFVNLFSGTEQLTPNAWSLTFEIIFYMLACLTVFFLLRRPSRLGAGVMIILSLAFLCFFPISAFFLFGVGVRILHGRGLLLPPRLARPLELITALACIYYASTGWFAYTPEDMADPLVWKIMAATACYFYLAVSPGSLTARFFSIREILYLGTVSYSLYLVHPYTYYASRTIFRHFGWFVDSWWLAMPAFFLVVTPITLIVTHFVHRWIEMKPYQWYFHQRIYRAPEAIE
jgi:peptidoglycan/LPS O-acetylase OafA/YrhL